MPLPINRNVTPIEELPELSDIENSFGNRSRGGGIEDVSGMGGVNKGADKYIRKLSRDSHQNTPYESNHYIVEKRYDDYQQEMFDPSQSPMPSQPPQQFTCLDVCNHIKGCPLCSKFYNNDNSLYIIIIIALLILVIILTKKVLNV